MLFSISQQIFKIFQAEAVRIHIPKLGIVILSLFVQAPAEAYDGGGDLAGQAVLEIIQLQKLTTLYSLRAGIPSFNRGRRNWCWDMGNGLPTEAGLIAATSLFNSHLHDKRIFSGGLYPDERVVTNHIDDSKITATLVPQIAGQVVGGAGSAFELGCTLAKQRRLKKDGLDRNAVIKKAQTIKASLDGKIAAMANLEDDSSKRQAHLLGTLETLSLAQLRCVLAKAKILHEGDNAADAISLGRNLIGATGNSINVAAILNNDRIFNGVGAILNLTAASLITTRPLAIISAHNLAKRQSDKQFADVFGTTSSTIDGAQTKVGLADLDRQINAQAPGLTPQILSLYRTVQSALGEPVCFDISADQDTKLMMLRRFRESLYGPEKITQATLGIVAGFRHQVNSTKDNQLAAAGNITYTSGQAFNILELSRERIIDERKHKKEKASGTLPEDLIKKRLSKLSELENLNALDEIKP